MKAVLIILLSVIGAFGQSRGPETVWYVVHPIPAADRTDLRISVTFKMPVDASLVIKLPTDSYGTPNLHKYVTAFTSNNGTQVTAGKAERERVVSPNASGQVSLEYLISYDPKELDRFAFAPVTHQTYFSLAGCQWLLQIGDNEQKYNVSVEVADPPKGWKFHSSVARNAEKFQYTATYREMISTRFGGGGRSYEFEIRGRPVSVFVNGDFNIPVTKIFAAVERIVRLQRDWFEDYSHPFYQVVINQRGGVIAGTAVKNQFVCFVRPTVSEHALNILLAHEMFHDWLPNRLDVQIADGDYRFRHEWFTEGFPTYFAKRILLDAGLLSAEKFADMVNEEIRELADNPESRATYSTLAAAMRDKRFTSEHKELAYNRGALIALNWESQLQRTTSERDLSGLVRELFKFAAARNAKITEEELFDFARKYGLDGRGDFERHIIRGQPIELNADVSRLLGKRFNWVEIDFPSFDPGFDLTDTRQTRIVTGVRADGPAFRAGLRNGMELVNLRNSRRGVGWSETRQLIVIARANGQERTIQLIPHGKPIRLRQIKY